MTFTAEERRLINQALAKAMAYKACGQDKKAQNWSMRLIYLLDTMDILDQRRLQATNVTQPDQL